MPMALHNGATNPRDITVPKIVYDMDVDIPRIYKHVLTLI